MPIIGIQASTYRISAIPAYFQIATQNISGASSYTFSSIPQTYHHLELRIFNKDSRSPIYSSTSFRLNGDTGTNYFNEAPQIDKRGVFAPSPGPNQSSLYANTNPGSSNSNYYGSGFVKVLNYSKTDRFKSTYSVGGYVALDDGSNEGGLIMHAVGAWLNTNAVTSLTLLSGGGNWQSGSVAALYGIKGAF
jgi:hypothetical protein